MTTQQVTITATMDAEAAYQLAQFCKRSHFSLFCELTEAHLPGDVRESRAYRMMSGIEAVQRGLAEAGFAPR
jgi:hypothetical protein